MINNKNAEKVSNFLINKITYEYEKFFLSMSGTSRENIFACSQEIELKKKAAAEMKKQVPELPTEQKCKMQLADNLLEGAFRYLTDHPDVTVEDGVRAYLMQFA